MAAVRRDNFPPQQQRHQNQPPQDGTTVIGQDGMLKIAGAPSGPIQGGDNRRTKSGRFTMAQLRDAIVPLQSGTNQFDSQKGKIGFGTPRNTSTRVEFADQGKRYPVEELSHRDSLIRLQSGTNKFDSQKGMTGFGMPRDVRGKHLKRIWELEFPEEETEGQPVNMQQQPQQGNGVYKPQQVNIIQSPGQFQQQQFQQHQRAHHPQQNFNQQQPSSHQFSQQQHQLKSPPAFR